MDYNELMILIGSPEDEIHDFKQQWYKPYDKSEMARDIFSFVNTTHHKNCYIILGVSDNGKIFGVQEDENRLNQQNIIDFISHLPIANEAVPKIFLQTFEVECHELDVIIIPETTEVPVYLSRKYPVKNGNGRQIYPGVIFSRTGDVNTPINEISNFYQVEALWKKHFQLRVPIQERYKYLLKDTENWSYTEQEENMGFIYNLNPDFFVAMEDDDMDRHQVEAISMDQFDITMGWYILKLKFRNLTIHTFLAVHLDGARHSMVVPNHGFIRQGGIMPLAYYMMLEDSTDYLVDYMMNHVPNSFTSYTSEQQRLSQQNMVIYRSKVEQHTTEKLIAEEYLNIKELIEPSREDIEMYSDKIRNEINKELEYKEQNVSHILRQRNLARFILHSTI